MRWNNENSEMSWTHIFTLLWTSITIIFHLKIDSASIRINNWCIYFCLNVTLDRFFFPFAERRKSSGSSHTSKIKSDETDQNMKPKLPVMRDKDRVDKILVFPSTVTRHCRAVMYSCALPHDVGEHWAPVHQIPLPCCLSRSPSVCSGLSEDPRSPTPLKAPCNLERLTGREMCVLLFHYLHTPLSLNQEPEQDCH